MTDFNELKSINVASVFDKKTVKEHLNKVLYTISGYVRGVSVIDGKYGEQTCFKGDFVAVNKLTGEVFVSSAAFLPSGLAREMQDRLDKSENREVKFSADIKATESKKNAQGYAWIADAPKTEEMVSQRQQLIQAALNDASKLKLLDAPKAKKTA